MANCPNADNPAYDVDYGIGHGHYCDPCKGTGTVADPPTPAVAYAIMQGDGTIAVDAEGQLCIYATRQLAAESLLPGTDDERIVELRLGTPAAVARRAVDQTIFDDGKGDCLRASVATVLGLTGEEVPNFAEFEFFKGLNKWLDERGLQAIEIRFADADHCARAFFNYGNGLVIAWGDSPRLRPDGRRKQHAVVGRPRGYGVEVVHDPHPSREGLHSCYGVMWIVPKSALRTEFADLLDDRGENADA